MSRTAAEQAADGALKFEPDAPTQGDWEGQCLIADVEQQETRVTFVWQDTWILRAARVFEPEGLGPVEQPRTETGIGVGSKELDIWEAYPHTLSRRPYSFEGEPENWFMHKPDVSTEDDLVIVFKMSDDKVVEVMAGYNDWLDSISDGCL